MQGSVTFSGVGQVVPPASELVTNEQAFALIREAGGSVLPINERTIGGKAGIKTRWYAHGRTSVDLAVKAAEIACTSASDNDRRFNLRRVEVIMSATSTRSREYPSDGTQVQYRLGIIGGQSEVQDPAAACTSWVSALALTYRTMLVEHMRYGLVTAGEVIGSRTQIPKIHKALWGDAGVATVLRWTPGGNRKVGIVGTKFASDGALGHFIYSSGMGTDCVPGELLGVEMGEYGYAVHQYVVKTVPGLVLKLLLKLGLPVTDRTWLIPHNGNRLMCEEVGAAIKFHATDPGIPSERVLTVLEHRGNTSSAAVPLSFVENYHRFQSGDLLLFVGFGAGMQMGAVAYVWP